MKKIDKLIASLKNMLIEFRSVNTDKAVLSWDGEDELQEGVAVYIKDEEGNNLVPEDGEYVAEDKITYVVENGIVREVIPAPDEEPAEEQPEAPAEEPAEEAPAEEPAEASLVILCADLQLVDVDDVLVCPDGLCDLLHLLLCQCDDIHNL